MSLAARIAGLLRGATARQGGLVLLDQGLLSFTNFLTGVLVARACTTGEYGSYVLAWSVLMIVLSAYKALVHIPFSVFLPRLDPAEAALYQGSAFLQTLAIALVAGGLTLGAVALGPAPGVDSGLAPVAGVLAILFVPFLVREFARNALFARLQFRASIVVSVLATGLQLAMVAGLFAAGRLGLAAALWVIGATSVLAAGLMLWLHRDQMRLALSRFGADLARGWHISRWSLLNVLGMIGTSQAYPWLLAGLASTSDVAVFGAAMAMAGVMAPFLQAANAYVLPRMAHGYKDGDLATLERMLGRSMLGLAVPYGAWVLVGGAFADPLMTLLYSDRYAGYAVVVWLLLVRGMVEAVAAPLNPALQTLERTGVTTVALFVGSLVTVTAGWYATGRFGVAGAAAGALLTTVATVAWKYWRFRRLVRARASAGG